MGEAPGRRVPAAGIRRALAFPPIPALERLCEWVRDAHRARYRLSIGLRLQQIFQDAGLPAQQLKCDAFVGGGPGWGYDQMLHMARNAMPAVISGGIRAAKLEGLDALAEQIRDAVRSQRSVTRAIDLVSAGTAPQRRSDERPRRSPS